MTRVLIAGAGSIGRRHLQNLRQLGVQDIHLYRTRPEPLKEAPDFARLYGPETSIGIQASSSYRIQPDRFPYGNSSRGGARRLSLIY